MRRAIAVAAFLVGCGPPKPPVPVDGWEVARAALLDGSSCYARRPEYCIAESDFVDSAIQQALDVRDDGKMPGFDKEVQRIIGSARAKYVRSLHSPAGLAKIEKIVAAYYEDPAVDTELVEGTVSVYAGALPGKLAIRGRGNTISLSETDLIEKFWWKPSEAGRMLAKYAEAHPDAAVIRIEIHIEKGSRKKYVYRYFRKQNRVAVGELGGNTLHVGSPVPGGVASMAAGSLELDTADMELCTGHRDSARCTEFCPWADPYAKAAKERDRNAK